MGESEEMPGHVPKKNRFSGNKIFLGVIDGENERFTGRAHVLAGVVSGDCCCGLCVLGGVALELARG